MPKIVDYWRSSDTPPELLPEIQGKLVGWGEPFCFRCGWLPPLRECYVVNDWKSLGGWLERAHLQDHEAGGSNDASNLVPLCVLCHRVMPEHDDRMSALNWVRRGTTRPAWWQLATDARWGADRWESCPGSRALMSLYFEVTSKVAAAREAAA